MIILAKTNCMISYPNVLMKIIKQIGITVACAGQSHSPQLSALGRRGYLPVKLRLPICRHEVSCPICLTWKSLNAIRRFRQRRF